MQIQNFMKIRPVWAELLHADEWTNRHDEDNSRFSPLFECTWKLLDERREKHPRRITVFVTHGFNLNKHKGIVLLDIEKAYDTVWITGLLYKLILLRLPAYLLFFLKYYLEGSTFTVHLNDATSTPKVTPSGLPQGVVLWTTLFALYFLTCHILHTLT